jgi:ATP-dependent DNA helicase PIF1
MNLSTEQKDAFDKYIQRKNLFITGPGGTGKSTLIKIIKADAEKRGLSIQVCALTGCAAVLLDCKAKTINSWAGIGLGNGAIQTIVNKITNNYFKKKAWKLVDVLVIDEVSMMSQKMMELLDAIAKAVRKNSRPFGGIQVIFLGDFYQLPPVGNKSEIETMRFCFESALWNETFERENIIQLKKIFRQTDEMYTNMLNQIREGRIKKSTNEVLAALVNKSREGETLIQPTKLFPTKNKIDGINFNEMNKLEGLEYEFVLKRLPRIPCPDQQAAMRDTFTQEQIDREIKNLESNLLCSDNIKLKVGCQVMCVVNIKLSEDEMICNGSQGIVKRFTEAKLPVVKFRNGVEMVMNYHIWESDIIPGVGVSQVPLILAWALTIHKSQGATMDVAEIDIGSGIFECGQTYVALSRVKSLEGLYITSYDVSKIFVNKKVREFYDSLKIPNKVEEK